MKVPSVPKSAVSADTLARVDAACSRAGVGAWQNVVSHAHAGAVFHVDFASRRSVSFVKEFAVLLSLHQLSLRVDSSLQVFLGKAAALVLAITQGKRITAPMLSRLGEVEDEEEDLIELSGPRRSAGVAYSRRSSKRPLTGCSVLVLDDEEISRRVLSAMLRDAGCSVRVTANAESAFILLRQERPDLVLLDVVLGGSIDGFGFCRAMRASDQCGSVPAIFVTGYPADKGRMEASRISKSAYFEKPVKIDQLSAAIIAPNANAA